MQNIQSRQNTILEILTSQPVFSQEDLLERLERRGFKTTQATLSRDLKALRVSKVPGEGYVIPVQTVRTTHANMADGLLSITFSGQLAVIKTHPGFAAAIAALVDHMPLPPVIGTLAGDDTVLLVLRADATGQQTLDALSHLFPKIRGLVK